MKRSLVWGLVLLAAGCAGRRGAVVEPAPEVVELPWAQLCPKSWQPRADVPRVRGIRVENQHADSIAVWVDICMGSVNVGLVAGSTTRLFRLPSDALLFGDSLRIDVFPLARTYEMRELRIRPDTSGVLHLVIAPWLIGSGP